MVAGKRALPHTGEAPNSGSGGKRRASAASARAQTFSSSTRGGASTSRNVRPAYAFGAGSSTAARESADDDDGTDDDEADEEDDEQDDAADSQENDGRESVSRPSSSRALPALPVAAAVQLISACFFTPGEVGKRTRWFCRLPDARENGLPFEPTWPQLNAWANKRFELPTLKVPHPIPHPIPHLTPHPTPHPTPHQELYYGLGLDEVQRAGSGRQLQLQMCSTDTSNPTPNPNPQPHP